MRSPITTLCRFGWRSATLTDSNTKSAYTFAHALDNASSASLGSVNNGDFQDQRYPNQNYGNADFDIRQRFVFSYVYDLPFGRGRVFAKDSSGVMNQIIGNWQMTGVVSAATGNYYTATDINNVSGGDCGGTVGYYCSRPNLVGNPNAKPCISGNAVQHLRVCRQHEPRDIRQRWTQHH